MRRKVERKAAEARSWTCRGGRWNQGRLSRVAVAVIVALTVAALAGAESQAQPDAWVVVSGVFERGGETDILVVESTTGQTFDLDEVDGAELVGLGVARRCHALVGPWTGGRVDEVGIFDLVAERLIDAETSASVCVGQAPLVALAGDWDGDRRDTAALFDLSEATFFEGLAACDPDPVSWQPAAEEWAFGPDPQPWVGGPDPQPWMPAVWTLVGDLATGFDEVLVAISPGSFGRQCWVPMLGDWDGDGVESLATFLPETGILVQPQPSASPVCSAAEASVELPFCFTYREMLKPIVVQDPVTGHVLLYVENWIEHRCCLESDGFHCTETVGSQAH